MEDITRLTSAVAPAPPVPAATSVCKKYVNSTGPPACKSCTIETRTECVVSSCTTSFEMSGSLTSGPVYTDNCTDIGLSEERVTASGYLDICNIIYDKTEGEAVSIGDSLHKDGTYLGPSVASSGAAFHFWEGVSVEGDLKVIGNLNVDGPLSVGGDLHVSGDLIANGDVLVSGKLTVCGMISVPKEEVSIVAQGSAEIRDMRISGGAALRGRFVSAGIVEVAAGGKLDIGAYDSFTFVRTEVTRAFRLMVDADGTIDVYGKLDASQLVSLQIANKGSIRSYQFDGTVDIFYDVFVYVNGSDRSQGELARHGKDLIVFPKTNGKITSVEVTVNGIPLDHGMYTYSSDSVGVLAPALDGVAGDIEIMVTSESDTMKEPKKEMSSHEEFADTSAAMLAALLPTVAACMIAKAKKGP